MESLFQMSLSITPFVSVFLQIMSNQGHRQWQYRMVFLGWALLDSQLSAFLDSQQIS